MIENLCLNFLLAFRMMDGHLTKFSNSRIQDKMKTYNKNFKVNYILLQLQIVRAI